MLRLEAVMFKSKSSQNIFDMERILKKKFTGGCESLLYSHLDKNIYIYFEV